MWYQVPMNAFAAPFQISHPSIGGLLAQHLMRIPDLQRPYAWKVDNARELCRDLEKLIESLDSGRPDPQHFFGTLVVLSVVGNRDEVIDGQQRITTVTLLLALVRNAFVSLNEECLAVARINAGNKSIVDHHTSVAIASENSANAVQQLLFIQDGFSADGGVIWSPRVEVSPEIRQTYRSFLEGNSGSVPEEDREPAINLRAVAGVFENRLIEPANYSALEPRQKFEHLTKILAVVKDGLILVRLGTPVAGSGFELFESLNARGLPLNVLDHLKVWMLATFAQQNQTGSIVAAKMRDLANDKIEEQVSFFEDFYKARTRDFARYDGLDSPKILVSRARRLLFRDPVELGSPDSMTITDRISFEVDYMTKLFPIWQKLSQHHGPDAFLPDVFQNTKNASWTRNRLEMLLGPVLRHQAAYPFLMVAADRLRDEPDVFGALIHLLEKFFFRYKTICGGSESAIVGLYVSFLEDLDANPGFNLEKIRADLKGRIESDANDLKFRTKLVEKLRYDAPASRNKIKYFFEMLDEYRYNPKPRKRPGVLALSQWHLEHIVPQNPGSGVPGLDEASLNSLGNLCLLPPWINVRLSNLSYADKRKEAQKLRDLPGKECVKIDLADAEDIFYYGDSEIWKLEDVTRRIAKLQQFACEVFTV